MQTAQSVDDQGVVQEIRAPRDLDYRIDRRKDAGPIDAGASDGVVGIRDSQYSPAHRDLVMRDSEGVARPIPPLMMGPHPGRNRL